MAPQAINRKVNNKPHKPNLCDLDVENHSFFPSVYRYISDPTSFCIQTKRQINVLNRFAYKGVLHKVVRIVRHEVKEGLNVYELKTFILK